MIDFKKVDDFAINQLEGIVYRKVIINLSSKLYGSRYLEAVHTYNSESREFEHKYEIIVNAETVYTTYSFYDAIEELKMTKFRDFKHQIKKND